MWILKNSKELLENLKAQSLHSAQSLKLKSGTIPSNMADKVIRILTFKMLEYLIDNIFVEFGGRVFPNNRHTDY